MANNFKEKLNSLPQNFKRLLIVSLIANAFAIIFFVWKIGNKLNYFPAFARTNSGDTINTEFEKFKKEQRLFFNARNDFFKMLPADSNAIVSKYA